MNVPTKGFRCELTTQAMMSLDRLMEDMIRCLWTLRGEPATTPGTTDSLKDAPADGSLYGRKDGTWTEIEIVAATWETLSGKPETFAPSAHEHSWDDLTDAPSTFPPESHVHAYGSLTDIPSTFAPSAHTHSYLEDAPSDGTRYGRKDGAWSAIPTAGGGGPWPLWIGV